MRILILSNLFPPEFVGGAEILCEQVCRALHARGHEVTVLTSGTAVEADARAAYPVLRTLRLTQPFGVPPPRISELDRWRTFRHNQHAAREHLARHRPDIVFAWSQRRLSLGAVRAAHDAGCPVAFSFNDDAIAAYVPASRPTPRGILRQWLNRTLLRPTTLSGLPMRHATAISRDLKQRLHRDGVDVRHTRVIYQALELDRFPLKDRPGSLHQPLRLLSASSLLEEKGVHTIVAAAHLLAQTRPVELTVLGDGRAEYAQRLQALARTGRARVDFAGRVPHDAMAAAYRAHDVLVFASSRAEAFGLTQLEAMASGTLVVSTAEGGHGEMLEEGRNALLFPFEDHRALAARVDALAASPSLACELARTARAQIEERFSFARYVNELEAFLASAAETPRALRPTA